MIKVQILLSTYNGEKFLREQLNSLYAQKNVSIQLLVRDDGSTDNTINILREYQKHFPLMILSGKNLGFAKSFWKLIQNANGADYYAFCDQDDVWNRDKLLCAIKKIRIFSDVPCLYTSNVIAVDKDLNIIKKNAFKFNGVLSLPDSLQRSVLPGCTFVFNQKLLNYAKEYKRKIITHDWLMYELAEIFGKVVYDPTPHIKYRIHEGNTIGLSNPIKKIFSEVKRQFIPTNLPRRSEVIKDILITYDEQIPVSKKKLLILFSEANKYKNYKKILSIREYRNINFILMLILKRI